MVSPCNCTGTSAHIHRDCYDQYIEHYPDRMCRVCNSRMKHTVKNADAGLGLGALGIVVVLLHNAELPIYLKAVFLMFFIGAIRSLQENGHLTGQFFMLFASMSAIVMATRSDTTMVMVNVAILFAGMFMTLGVYVTPEGAMACVFSMIAYIYLVLLYMRILFETDIWTNVLALLFLYTAWYGWFMMRQPLMAPVPH
jgi:hypothetical protein